MSRRSPRPLAAAVASLGTRIAPQSTIAEVQGVWASAVGERIAAAAQAVSEHGGVLTVACREAVWAAELELMGPQLVERLNETLGRPALKAVRCRATGTTGTR